MRDATRGRTRIKHAADGGVVGMYTGERGGGRGHTGAAVTFFLMVAVRALWRALFW